MTPESGANKYVKVPLEELVKQDPLSLLKNGKILEAELAQEHQLLFTHLFTFNYIKNYGLSKKLESIYSRLIYDLLKNVIIQDSLDYLASGNLKLSSEDFSAYHTFALNRYHLSTHFPLNYFYEVCREHIRKMKEKGLDVTEAEFILS